MKKRLRVARFCSTTGRLVFLDKDPELFELAYRRTNNPSGIMGGMPPCRATKDELKPHRALAEALAAWRVEMPPKAPEGVDPIVRFDPFGHNGIDDHLVIGWVFRDGAVDFPGSICRLSKEILDGGDFSVIDRAFAFYASAPQDVGIVEVR